MKYFLDAYKYCPICSGKIGWMKDFLKCEECGFCIFDNPKPASNIILENEKNEILLVTRKIDPYKGWLDFPGGFVQSGESFEEAAKREALEEIGIEVQVQKYISSHQVEYEYKDLIYKLTVAWFKGVADFSKITVGDDVSGFEFVPRDKIFSIKLSFPESHVPLIEEYLKMFPVKL